MSENVVPTDKLSLKSEEKWKVNNTDVEAPNLVVRMDKVSDVFKTKKKNSFVHFYICK